ncbi:hypothetical protein F2P56_034005 [Juglans regia]|uniref:Uncharacterized protein LOC108990367 n=2 Tax=Juglans regia TaxID=51240 RepID=A0A2I4EKE3_JUGRE|nr:uncharacterized protein LOC108990367 [Juglans regia]KAF5444913.1 hypothetical protein F2P56_034005 [Juglans regia]
MAPLKSPSPDGFGASFYKKYWSLIGDKVCAAVLNFLNGGQLDPDCNFTFLALIPKVKSPVSVGEFRPISLCNVYYKLIAKTLANRLKMVLPNIISQSQSAFIAGRLITDNVIIAYETLHSMKHRKKGKHGNMAIKLDMSKAYDRVEWGFLRAVMLELGFHVRWVELIMQCVSSVHYDVLVNGQPGSKIIPTRGLRQGDPLSPYLFLLCAEGLSSLIKHAERTGLVKGVKVARGGTSICQLMFADDCILFCTANKEEWRQLESILGCYEVASRQKLNKQKTSVYFSSNTPQQIRNILVADIGASSCGDFDRYLGLPSVVWRLLVKPDSFVATIMKEKYYRHCSIMDAKLGGGPSLIWRSLLGAREVVSEGMRWRVGNGQHIRIWGDKWMPTPSSYMVQSPVSSLGQEAFVADLIDETSGCWKYDLVRETFNREEAALICTLPVSRMSLVDKLFWGPAKNGLFSVKSAYYVAMELKRQLGGEPSAEKGSDMVWKNMWKLNIPNYIKVFLWRALTNCLPTKDNLLRRKLVDSGMCPICEQVEETSGHVLWSCVATSDVWSETMSKAQKLICREQDFLVTWSDLSQKLVRNELESMAFIFSKVWQRRNKWIFEHSFQSPAAIVSAAMADREEYFIAKGELNAGLFVSSPVNRDIHWHAPTLHPYKVNWDAGFDQSTHRMGVGIVIRDGVGDVIAFVCMPGYDVRDAVVAEANALWRAITLCEKIGIVDAILEGDALKVIKEVHDGEENCAWYGQVIEDIKLKLRFGQRWLLQYAPRESNVVAHRLAKFAMQCEEEKVWLEDCPDWIKPCIQLEKLCISSME